MAFTAFSGLTGTIANLNAYLTQLFLLRELISDPGYTAATPKIALDASGRLLNVSGAGWGTNATGLTMSLQGGDAAGTFAASGAAIALRGSTAGFNNNGLEVYAGGVEAYRINSSLQLMYGTSTDWTGGFSRATFYINTAPGRALSVYNANNSAGSALLARVDFTATRLAEFYYTGATSVGTITTNGTTTAYNTSSDARLKTEVAEAADAGELIDAMRVVQFKWKSNGDFSRYGFIAQELHQVAPEAVTAGDTADEIEVTWGVDAAKLVPLLVKELQSVRARLAALESAA